MPFVEHPPSDIAGLRKWPGNQDVRDSDDRERGWARIDLIVALCRLQLLRFRFLRCCPLLSFLRRCSLDAWHRWVSDSDPEFDFQIGVAAARDRREIGSAVDGRLAMLSSLSLDCRGS